MTKPALALILGTVTTAKLELEKLTKPKAATPKQGTKTTKAAEKQVGIESSGKAAVQGGGRGRGRGRGRGQSKKKNVDAAAKASKKKESKEVEAKLWLFLTKKYRGKVRSSCLVFLA